ncbi:zf-CCHC domain-containing protein, partial [Tanacetum coccineum]
DRVKLCIEGSEISLQERESKLYDEFNMFTLVPEETIHTYYLRFVQLINDMHSIRMTMKLIQINTKFINHLQHEWRKFMTDVKLVKDLHITNINLMYGYLRQHEPHVNEVRLTRKRYLDPIALVANTSNSSPSYSNQSQYHQQISPIAQQYYSHLVIVSLIIHQQSSLAPNINQPSVVQKQFYQPPDAHYSSLDSRLVVPSFLPSNDHITSLNKAMAFISTTFASRYPPTNNQLRTSSNPRNQATIQDGKVTVQTIQGRQTQGYAGSGVRRNATRSSFNRNRGISTAGSTKVTRCYNCQEEGHVARQCTKPKRPRNSAWFKEKEMLAEAL